jgi:hypothetical protein
MKIAAMSRANMNIIILFGADCFVVMWGFVSSCLVSYLRDAFTT